ncbi:MAG: HEAT repeat domain-containing protein [Clostridia bacterium]|nr:HEAT repeat domain-containing protein [Clostridia bacterium]
MGLFDFLKKKPLSEKVEEYAQKGMIGKLMKLTEATQPKENRLLAIDALRIIKHRMSVDHLANVMLRDPDIDIRTQAAKSLLMNGTKDKTDLLLNYSEEEKELGNEELAELLKRAAIDARDRTRRDD